MKRLVLFLVVYLGLLLTATSQLNTIKPATQTDVIANDDKAVINEDEVVDIPVLINDFGLFDGVKSLVVKSLPSNGSAIVNDDNTIKYTPDLSFHGDDVFTYEVCNIDGSCDWATVDITIDDIDHKPIAVNDTVTYLHGTEITVPILNNDIINGDFPFTVDILQNVKHGDAYLDENNEIVPSFNRTYGGKDSLQYVLCDADNDCSTAWVIFTVQHDGTTDFFIPNGFSPNGDGLNDLFYIPDFKTYTNIAVQIVNTWGQLVYSSDNYLNDWDGVANKGASSGKLLDAGTYYYVFSIPGFDDSFTGYIYLSR